MGNTPVVPIIWGGDGKPNTPITGYSCGGGGSSGKVCNEIRGATHPRGGLFQYTEEMVHALSLIMLFCILATILYRMYLRLKKATCPYCGQKGKKNDMPAHYQVCPRYKALVRTDIV